MDIAKTKYLIQKKEPILIAKVCAVVDGSSKSEWNFLYVWLVRGTHNQIILSCRIEKKKEEKISEHIEHFVR